MRVYAVTFPTDKLMKEYKVRIEEAKKRDHRVIGLNQELFFFHNLSPGSCFFLPDGAKIYNNLINFIKEKYWKYEYDEVVTPNIYNFDLWKTWAMPRTTRRTCSASTWRRRSSGSSP